MSSQRPRVLNKRTDVIPPSAKYCGRGSKWGNPFTHLKGKTLATFVVNSRDEACEAFEHWFHQQPELVAALPELRGHDLVCYCAPQRCHCHTLIKLANPDLTFDF